MERQSAARGGKAPRKRRRASPLPGAAGSRAGESQPCRRRLFRSAGRGPEPGGLKRKSGVKVLPKIKENLEDNSASQSCSQSCSSRVNAKETRGLEKREDKIEESTVPLKESLLINFESKESLKVAEVSSSTTMTLPTGVSSFLLECLDVDSTAYYNMDTSDSLSNCPSPETFRDEASERSNLNPVDSGKYKNSTLLDSSKAVTIDKIPQISNLSAILEPALADFQDKCTRRKRPSNCSYTSSALNVSTIMAGKKVCKITAARETTPDLKSGMRCPSPLGPERKPAKQTAKCKRLKSEKKEKTSDTAGEGTLSFSQLDAPGDPSAKSRGLTTQILTSKQTSVVVQMSSAVLIVEENKVVESVDSARPAEPDPLCGREICSIVRTSPNRRSSRPPRTPANKKAFSFPKRLPEVDLEDSDSSKQVTAQMCTEHQTSIILQVPKIGSTVNADEISGFQEESTEERDVSLSWQGDETEH